MANVQISDLPPVTLPIVQAVTYFEVETLEAGVPVSRKIAAASLPGSGVVVSVNSGVNISVDSTNPAAPIVNLLAAIVGVSVNGVTLTAAGGGTLFLANDGTYKAAGGSLPAGNQFNTLYLSTAPNTYSATSNLTIDPSVPGVQVRGLLNNAINGTQDSVITFQNSSGGLASGAATLGFQSGIAFFVYNRTRGGGVNIRGDNTSGAAQTFLSGLSDANVLLYYSGVNKFETTPTGIEATDGNSFGTGIFSGENMVFSGSGTTSPHIGTTRYSADANGPILGGRKSRSAAIGGNTIVQNNDTLVSFSGWGNDGAGIFSQAGSISIQVDGTPGVDPDMPGRIVLSTSADGTATPLERMRISQSGQVTVTPLGTYSAPPTQGGLAVSLGIVGVGGLSVDRYQNTTAGSPAFASLRRGRGSVGSGSIVLQDDEVGRLEFSGYNGTGFTPAATISALVDGVPGAANDMPGRLIFSTTTDNVGAAVEVFRISANSQFAYTANKQPYAVPQQLGAVTQFFVMQAAGDPRVYIAGNSNQASLSFSRSSSAAAGGIGVVAQNDIISALTFYGADGTTMQPAASIQAVIDAAPGAGDMPGRLVFSTTLDGTTTLSERMRIINSGASWFTLNGNTFAFPSGNVFGAAASGLGGVVVQHTGSALSYMGFRYSADALGPSISFAKSRNATLGSNTIVANNDVVGSMDFHGADGTNYINVARIMGTIDAVPSGGVPGRLTFWTTPNGTTTAVEALRIASTGLVSGLSFIQAVKTSNTNRNTTTVLVADPDLNVVVEANRMYQVEICLRVTSASATPGFKWTLTQPGGNDWFLSGVSKDNTNTAKAEFFEFGGAPYSLGNVNAQYTINVTGILNITVAGNVSIDWSQVVSNGTNVTLGIGSFLKLRRLN